MHGKGLSNVLREKMDENRGFTLLTFLLGGREGKKEKKTYQKTNRCENDILKSEGFDAVFLNVFFHPPVGLVFSPPPRHLRGR